MNDAPYKYHLVTLNDKQYSVKVYLDDDWYRGQITIETSWEIPHLADRYLVCPRTITRYKRIDPTGTLGKKILKQIEAKQTKEIQK